MTREQMLDAQAKQHAYDWLLQDSETIAEYDTAWFYFNVRSHSQDIVWC